MNIDGYNDDDIKGSLSWILCTKGNFEQKALDALFAYCKRLRGASYAEGKSKAQLVSLLLKLSVDLVEINDSTRLKDKSAYLIRLMHDFIREIDHEN